MSRSRHWRKPGIDAIKAEVSATLKAMASHKERLGYCLAKISENRETIDDAALMQTWVAAVAALVWHERQGGLSSAQVSELGELASSILTLQNVDQEHSAISFLWRDLYAVLSQIARKEGDHFGAAWQQLRCCFVKSPDFLVEDQAHFLHGLAIRQLRLGDADLALSSIDSALALGPDSKRRGRLIALKALAHRLRLDSAGLRSVAEELDGEQDDAIVNAVAWERKIGEFLKAPSAGIIQQLVEANGAFDAPGYFLEGWLLAMAQPDPALRALVPKIRSRARSKGTRAQDAGILYKLSLAIEYCHEPEAPIDVRMVRLGDALARARQLLGLNEELLIYLAAARFLWLHKRYDHMDLVLREYQMYSARISCGASGDAWGVLPTYHLN